MKISCIIDAHMHLSPPGGFFVPQVSFSDYLRLMDSLNISHSVCAGDHPAITEGGHTTLPALENCYQQSHGRMFYLGVFHPRYEKDCMRAFEKAIRSKGFVGLKLHPSFHGVPADDDMYKPAWEFAVANDLAILTHSWSASETNPSQKLSTPQRFERFISEFPKARLVLGHAGGRGGGRKEAVNLVKRYPNVFTDIAGDIFCFELLKNLIKDIPSNRILFGSDYPWLDPRANLARVLLADITEEDKLNIVRKSALTAYKIGERV